jgi:hypothetical protein
MYSSSFVPDMSFVRLLFGRQRSSIDIVPSLGSRSVLLFSWGLWRGSRRNSPRTSGSGAWGERIVQDSTVQAC